MPDRSGSTSAITLARLLASDRARIRNQRIGFVFQNFNLLARTTALENVELPMLYKGIEARERRTRALAALRAPGLGERADHQPSQLSGGQQQRVAIARALVNRPAIILADEPTGNLDSTRAHELLKLLREMVNHDSLTILMVTHDHELATSFADRIIQMKDGKVMKQTMNAE